MLTHAKQILKGYPGTCFTTAFAMVHCGLAHIKEMQEETVSTRDKATDFTTSVVVTIVGFAMVGYLLDLARSTWKNTRPGPLAALDDTSSPSRLQRAVGFFRGNHEWLGWKFLTLGTLLACADTLFAHWKLLNGDASGADKATKFIADATLMIVGFAILGALIDYGRSTRHNTGKDVGSPYDRIPEDPSDAAATPINTGSRIGYGASAGGT